MRFPHHYERYMRVKKEKEKEMEGVRNREKGSNRMRDRERDRDSGGERDRDSESFGAQFPGGWVKQLSNYQEVIIGNSDLLFKGFPL